MSEFDDSDTWPNSMHCERIAMCAHPDGTHEHIPLRPGEDTPETCFADCDCKPVVFVRDDVHAGRGALDDMYAEFARQLAETNRKLLLKSQPAIRERDPRDIAEHLESMLAARRMLGDVTMEHVVAWGAICLGLGLAVQRVEDGRSELGDAA